MKELHARVEESLARAKAVLENPNSSQEEVNTQVQAMKALTEEVNKALAGGLTSPAQLGEGRSATQSEPSPTPRQGRRGRKPQTPPAAPVSTENQETKETAEEATDYTNGPGSYPLSENIHNLLQELKTSTENPKQVQKLKEAYDKLNEALGQSDNGLVDQEVFNVALEEYKKAAQLKNGAEGAAKTRSRKSVSGLATGRPGRERRLTNSDGSGSERSAEETSNSDQRTPARRARSIGENPDTVNRASQSSPAGSSQPVTMWADRRSALNSGYAYGISPVPVPDNKFNDGSYLEDLNRWAPAFTSWLNANSNTETFYLYYDSVFEEYTIKRLKPISGRRGTHLYRDEAVQHSQTIDIFTKHPEVTYVTLGIVPGGGGSAYLKFISGQKEVKKIVIPKQDLYIRQSEYDAQARERERLEAEARKRNAVKAGLGSRKGSTNSIDERGAVRIPHKVSLKGFQLFVLGESSEEKITDVDINNIDGLGLIKNKISIGTHQAALQLQTAQNGNQELAKTVFGRRTVTVRTTTQGGNVATKDITLTFGMPTPRITTSNDDLREKSNTKPTVKATIPGPIDPRNIPQGHKLMMFLVSGGSNDSSDHDDVHATGYHIVAQTEVGQDGQAIFGESKYIDGQIGTQNLRAVAAVVPDGTTTPLQGLVSALSENFVAATEPLRKDAAQQALEDAAQRKRDAIDQDKGLIDTEKQAAKEKVNEALEAAKRTLQDATNEDGIRDAQQGGERAIQNVGQTGVAKPTAQQALEDAAQRKRDAIDQDKGLIDTEKQAAKEKVNEALEAAKRTLQDATNEDGIRDAQQGGERAIQNVGQTGVAKPTAQQALEDAAQSGTNPVTPPSATRSRRTPPRRSRRSVGFVGNSQTGT
ncbi:DUF1542 domain-containing protein, partial [Streptococcus pneumoniae]|nr:DUF1542 domain-containing protein [Streptococcus pneumoniae]MDS5301552.1 DUF1542 domain-containing protein [Streptococcus pneumoniae]MDS5514663.1 DUF1542 domain-containing protein [Streptococcus pneumoniae]